MSYKFIDENKEHLHTFQGKALTGTSSVVDVLAKPLTWWASGLACEKLGWTNGKKKINGKYQIIPIEERLAKLEPVFKTIKDMDTVSFLNLLDKAYCAHKDSLEKSASKGTDLHAELEKFVKSEMGKTKYEDSELDSKITPFVEWARANVKKYLWSEGHCYSERLWCGGISDVGAELNDGSFAIIDFKSAKEAYTSHFIQAAGYAIEVEENGVWDSEGKHNKKIEQPITSLIIVPFGANPVLPVIMRDIEAYKKGFEAAVVLYRLLFNHTESA